MKMSESVEVLESAWSEEDGFLFRLRVGEFETAKSASFLATLRKIDADQDNVLNRRAVSLLWYVPLFLEWQRERIDKKYWSELNLLITSVTNEVERLLGVP